MSLVICKECHAEISSDAKLCPHCGKKLKIGCFSIVLIIIGVFFIVTIFASIISNFQNPSGTNQTESIENLKIDAYIHSKHLIENHLKAPSTADFASYNESTIINEGELFTVTSYVDAQNSFGAKLRMYFVVKLNHNNSGWNIISYKMLDN